MPIPDEPSDSPITIRLREPGEDAELKAMAYCWSVLCELNQVQRDRAIEWLSARNQAAKKHGAR